MRYAQCIVFASFFTCSLCAGEGGAIGPKGPTTGPARPRQNLAKRIVFVCEGSDSMIPKIAVLRNELEKAISGLTSEQSFGVLFMNKAEATALDRNLLAGGPENLEKAKAFLDAFTPGGKTDPVPAVKQAFSLEPKLIYLLCDHDFPDTDALIKTFQTLNSHHHVKVNTIAFVDDADKDTDFLKALKQIAEENGGTFKFTHVNDMK